MTRPYSAPPGPGLTSGPSRTPRLTSPTRLFATALALLATACAGDSSVDPVEVRNLTLSVEPTRLFVAQGQDGRLHARLTDDAGKAVPMADLSWTSSDPAIARVDDTGLVTGLGDGSVLVTASANGKKKDADVTVRGKGKLEIHLSSGTGQSGPVGEPLDQPLIVELRDGSGESVSGVEVRWKIKDDGSTSASTTTTNQNGLTQVLWTLGSTLGEQTLQAQVPGAGTVDFHATGTPGLPASVTVSPDDVSMGVGDSQQFSAAVTDRFGNPVNDVSLIWATTAGDVADVDSTGLATGRSAGTALVEAYAASASDGATVEVTGDDDAAPEVASIAASPDEHTFTALGQSVQLEATAYDGSSQPLSGITFNWSSTDASIADVDDMGLVLAKAVGTAYMVVSAACCDAAADTVPVAVTQVPAAVQVSPASFALDVAQTTDLNAEVRDSEGNLMSHDVSWTSSDALIASVDDQGVVTALAAGSVTIEAHAGGLTGAASGEVTEPASAEAPGDVTDLAHAGDGILTWTQVDDGTGQPADYAIRSGCPTVSWGSAYDTEVTVAGTAIGESLEYDTNQASGSCEYQLIAYRGTLNVDAVFSTPSNIATVTFETAQVPTSIEVSPSSFSLDVGQTQQLSATVLDESGVAIAGEEVVWSSAAPSVASISSAGLVTALAEGSVQLEARLVSTSGTSAASTTSGPSGSSSSEVVGVSSATVQSDDETGDGGDGGTGSTDPLFLDDFDSGDLSSSTNGFSWGAHGGNVTVVSQGSMIGAAPRSGEHALEFYFKKSDQISAELRFSLPNTPYLALEYDLYWPADWVHNDPGGATNNKFSAVWMDTYEGTFKVTTSYIRTSNGNSKHDMLAVQTGGATTENNPDPLVSPSGPIVPGQWSKIRLVHRAATGLGKSDGLYQMWVNGSVVSELSEFEFWNIAGAPSTYMNRGYLFGAANSGMDKDYHFYIDNFKVYASDPGW